MTVAPYVISVELTRAERELLIRMLEQRPEFVGEASGSNAYKLFDSRNAQDLLDRLRRP